MPGVKQLGLKLTVIQLQYTFPGAVIVMQCFVTDLTFQGQENIWITNQNEMQNLR